MDKRYYPNLNETVYNTTLANGLTVKLLPKLAFNKSYALFTADFGSIDTSFVPYGEDKIVKAPNGIAHFLEHVLFKSETGDAMNDFQSLGASSNAYTSYTQTAYLFSASDLLEENVALLLDFVQEPYFTNQIVNEERDIIAQEIAMYQDDPDDRILNGLVEQLYPQHPVQHDILGTAGSLATITPELLYQTYRTFYHPSNMTLQIAGQMDVVRLLDEINGNQADKTFTAAQVIKRENLQEDIEQIVTYREEKADVSRPKVSIGLRGPTRQLSEIMPYREKLALYIFMDMLFGSLSKARLALYDQSILDSSFFYTLYTQRGLDFIYMEFSSYQVEKSIAAIKNLLFSYKENPEINAKHLMSIKKRLMGQQIKSLNNVEYLARQLISPYDKQKNMFDYMDVLTNITIEDVLEVAGRYIVEERLAVFVLQPKTNES